MNMRKASLNILLAVGAAIALSSCGGQDEIYKEWVKKGGYDYPAKALKLTSVIGYKSVIINWEKPMDPAVRTASLFWDNYAKSVDIDYADYPDGKVSVSVGDLEDRSYTFDIVNYDDEGNQSLAAEITVSPYGDGWMVSRSERSVARAEMDENGRDARIVMSKATDEMVATRFRYKNLQDEWVECETVLKPGENEVTFPNALKGKRFEYSSSFCPAKGKDTVWTAWTKSIDGISYKLDGKRWIVKSTTNQDFSSDYAPNKIFDSDTLYGWTSTNKAAYKLIFPKVLSVDTQAQAGKEYSFTRFEFYQDGQNRSYRYIQDFLIFVGSSYYNPDETDTKNYGIQFLEGSFNTSSHLQSVSASQGASGRYFAIVFKNSFSTEDGYIDLKELVPYGYIPSQAD